VDGIRSEQVDASSSVCPDGIVGIRSQGFPLCRIIKLSRSMVCIYAFNDISDPFEH